MPRQTARAWVEDAVNGNARVGIRARESFQKLAVANGYELAIQALLTCLKLRLEVYGGMNTLMRGPSTRHPKDLRGDVMHAAKMPNQVSDDKSVFPYGSSNRRM